MRKLVQAGEMCSDRVIIAASGLGHLKEGEFGTHCHIRDEFYS